MSPAKIIIRLRQIENSIEQARTMLKSMEQLKHAIVSVSLDFELKDFRGFIFVAEY